MRVCEASDILIHRFSARSQLTIDTHNEIAEPQTPLYTHEESGATEGNIHKRG